MLCTTMPWCNYPKNTPQFLGGVSKFLCADIRRPSWKYDFGRIFKITRTCWNEIRRCVQLRKNYGTTIHIHRKKDLAKIMNTTMADPIAGSNGMDIFNIAAPPPANPFRWPSRGLVRRILFNYVNQLRKQYIYWKHLFYFNFHIHLIRSPQNDGIALPPRSPRLSFIVSFSSFIAPAYIWLVVMFVVVWRPSKAMTYCIFLFFRRLYRRPKHAKTPPLTPSTAVARPPR